MIAQVLVDDEGEIFVFTLGDDRLWVCHEFPELADTLNLLHRETFGPWNGQPGAWQAHNAAELLHGKITFLAKPEALDPSTPS